MLVATILAAGATRVLEAHPIHTTLSRITYDSVNRAIVVSVRVFSDDFALAVGRYSGVMAGPDHVVPPAAAYGYMRTALTLTDATGAPLPLEWCGSKRTGAVDWICVRVPSPASPRGLRVLNALLFEVHDDQVNLVQATIAGKNASVLFTRGDRARRIP